MIKPKLVRNGIPRLIAEAGKTCETRVLDEVEYCRALRAKLVEEAEEVKAEVDRSALVAELADVAEVMEALMEAYGIDPAQVRLAQDEKRAQRGGFEDRVELVRVEEA